MADPAYNQNQVDPLEMIRLLVSGAQPSNAPFSAPQLTSTDPLDELRKHLMGETYTTPPPMEIPPQEQGNTSSLPMILSALGDAISNYGSRQAGQQPTSNALQQLVEVRRARKERETQQTNVNKQEQARISRERAAHELGVVESQISQQRETAQRKSEKESEREARAAERKLDEERQMAREKANLEWRQADREDEQAFRMRMQDAELKSRQDIADLKDAATTATERQIADAKELKETNARKGILALRDDIPTQLASGKTADQIRAKFHESLDSVHIDPGTPEHDAAMAYFGMKVEPLLKAQEDAISAGKKKGVEREAQKKEGQRKLGQARQVRRYDLGKV